MNNGASDPASALGTAIVIIGNDLRNRLAPWSVFGCHGNLGLDLVLGCGRLGSFLAGSRRLRQPRFGQKARSLGFPL